MAPRAKLKHSGVLWFKERERKVGKKQVELRLSFCPVTMRRKDEIIG